MTFDREHWDWDCQEPFSEVYSRWLKQQTESDTTPKLAFSKKPH